VIVIPILASEVVEIMSGSMADTLSDASGALDFTRSVHGSGTSTRGVAKKFIAALTRHAELTDKNVFAVEELKQVLASFGGRVPNFYDFLATLNTQGYLLKKAAKTYQLLCVDG